MEIRIFGRSGLQVSVLGFGAGAVGGLMVRGSAADQDRAVGRAIDAGITYFDTAPAYGDGLSETHLGRALRGFPGATAILGTKIRIRPEQWADPAAAIAGSIDASLARLGRDSVDLLQLHNPITEAGGAGTWSLAQLREVALPALRRVQAAGKARHIGITALGETAALRAVVDAGDFDAAQLPFNLLNPSAIGERPAGFSGHDFDGLMTEMTAAGMGVIGIRILAAGALSGEAARHPVAQPEVAPIGSGADYAADLAEARRLLPLVEEGFVGSLVEAAIRFAITAPNLATSLIGLASLEQLEVAIRAAERGPLPLEALERIGQLQG